MKRFSSTLETKHRLQKRGDPVVIVTEEWRGVHKHDLFNCVDVVSFDGAGWSAYQACTENDFRAHMKKIDANQEIRDNWIIFGFGFELWVYPNKESRDEGDTEPRVVVIAPATRRK